MGISYIGYLNYVTSLFLCTGVLMLVLDVRFYKGHKQKREKRAAQWSAWINISLGVVLLIGSWWVRNYYW